MRRSAGTFAVAAVGILLVGCGKSTSPTADSSAVAFDAAAARAAIVAADSAWMRAVLAKNVDSLMPHYASDAVSMSEGTKAVKGTGEIRTSYESFVKANPRDISVKIGDVSFSDDGTMAWDYGSYAGTIDGPGGKPAKVGGNFLNVWKNVNGKWIMVAEINNSAP
jgi:ketosteroid isomerase-like protein